MLRLLRQERAWGVLRELAGAPVGGDGQLPRLPADALVRPRVACSLPAASVLSLGGVRGWEVSSCPLTCEEEKEHQTG